MISRLISFSILILSTVVTAAQDSIWTRQVKTSEIIAFEKSMSPETEFLSQTVGMSKDYFPLADKYPLSTSPVIAKRKGMGYLPLYAEYFYTKKDSVIRLISYNWERGRYGNFFDLPAIWKEESKNFDVYDELYETLREILNKKFGEPVSTDKKATKVKSKQGGSYRKRETAWDNESIHASLNMIFASQTYRVRFTMYWKQ
jgi:hypothetical protein